MHTTVYDTVDYTVDKQVSEVVPREVSTTTKEKKIYSHTHQLDHSRSGYGRGYGSRYGH